MSVLDSLAEIREQALAELRSRKSLDELDQLRAQIEQRKELQAQCDVCHCYTSQNPLAWAC